MDKDRTREAMVAAGTCVADRIKASARNTGQDAQFLFIRFALERLLVRLGLTEHAGDWCLKGGMVMLTLGDDYRRPTEDLDLTTLSAFEPQPLIDAFRKIAAVRTPDEDGLTYEVDARACHVVREESANSGLRVMLDALLHTRTAAVQIRLKLDAAHGDAITPQPRFDRLPPTCRGFDPPLVPVYPWETVVAEKLHAITRHGLLNTRLKDFYDLVAISRSMPLQGPDLSAAVLATFRTRGRPGIEAEPAGLGGDFAASREKDWKKFMASKGLGAGVGSMADAVGEVRAFASPLLSSLAAGRVMDGEWNPGKGWEPSMSPISAPWESASAAPSPRM